MDGEKWPVFFEVEVGGWLVGLSVTLADNQLGSKLHHQQLLSTNPAFTSPPTNLLHFSADQITIARTQKKLIRFLRRYITLRLSFEKNSKKN